MLLMFGGPLGRLSYNLSLSGPVAQLVEQRIENPRVGSSILPQATSIKRPTVLSWAFSFVLSLSVRGPRHLNLQMIRGRNEPLPRAWAEQRKLLGFDA